MNDRIKEIGEKAGLFMERQHPGGFPNEELSVAYKFAELIVQECIDKIETHQIPVGNSAAGEMACEWTYDALKEIRNEIKEHFGVEE